MKGLYKLIFGTSEETNITDIFPTDFNITLAATFSIGLIAHMFIFTNPIYGHDAIRMYWNEMSIIEAAGSGRILVPFWQRLLDNIFQPWLSGMLTLLFYSISSYLICRCFKIKHTLSIILISGLMVTSPTAISSNMYLSSSYIYAGALLLACAAVYYYEKSKYGIVYAFIFMVLCGATYTAYISFGVSLFVIRCIIGILNYEYNDWKQVLDKQICFFAISAASLLTNVFMLVKWGSQSVIRGVEVAGGSSSLINTILRCLEGIINTYPKTIRYYLPTNSISYFQDEKILYLIFCGAAIATIVVIFLLVKKQLNKKIMLKVILCADFFVLPIAMDILGILYESHLLMQSAFILPWLFYIFIYEIVCDDSYFVLKNEKRNLKSWSMMIYLIVCIGCSIYSIGNRIKVANVAYAKAYSNYEAALSKANRIVAKIERVDSYIPGETKVIFVGKIEGNNHLGAYELVEDITGIGSNFLDGYWDSAIPGIFALKVLIQQQLAVNMDIIAPENNNEISFFKSYNVEEILTEIDDGFENISEDIRELDAYSDDNYYIMKDNILIVKIS